MTAVSSPIGGYKPNSPAGLGTDFGELLMRLLSCAVACTSVLIALTLPAAAEALRPPAMQFTLSIEGPESACADACRRFVSASGMIRADTATEFRILCRA
ncbi:MAG: hypothetical protein M5U33_07515 [Pseudorhodoplanes sp.]|nr:hypothetical protein [Pseudorhodoplanes sp.]